MRPLESARRRMHGLDPFKVDIAIAALFMVVAAIELYHLDSEGHNRPVTMVAGIICLSSLAFRRRNPLLAAVIFSVPTVLQAFFDGFLTKNSTTPFVGMILLLYSVGRYAEGRQLRATLAILVGSLVLTLGVEVGFDGFSDVLWLTFLFGLPVLAGRSLRSRALLQAELREKAERAERDRAERSRTAVEDERVRIATELQELVANGLSAMVVQAGAVPRAVDAGDTVRAGAALAAVETTGREALTEMRTLLGVLRREGDGAQLAPQPGLARLETLVERTRERGLDVSLGVDGGRRELPPGIDLTAYRVIEDALDAAAENAARAADVLVRYTPRELQLQVNDDRSAGDSDRLAGLRERVGLYGGHLRAGVLETGGFRLRATLPLEERG
ncbi:MAG TPA: histidine kinase [Thermoleophilaceae bacterium]|nr:histidine kinase [Thermoleophilaceae bacterium]